MKTAIAPIVLLLLACVSVPQIARHHYPNLRTVYLSSCTSGGWSGRASGSPEPYA